MVLRPPAGLHKGFQGGERHGKTWLNAASKREEVQVPAVAPSRWDLTGLEWSEKQMSEGGGVKEVSGRPAGTPGRGDLREGQASGWRGARTDGSPAVASADLMDRPHLVVVGLGCGVAEMPRLAPEERRAHRRVLESPTDPGRLQVRGRPVTLCASGEVPTAAGSRRINRKGGWAPAQPLEQ
ncbi:hypothetical protein NDU88_002936 [Pleurodeles waltl]|uniref:Uncharacterized protein n=1 Tax=Pleurodeles waltl TaxID=8319 RepID=A0AAV7T3R8_PLEWA|nr:hypothetical protein NDU88_002936 [Pleurodeles waltl]